MTEHRSLVNLSSHSPSMSQSSDLYSQQHAEGISSCFHSQQSNNNANCGGVTWKATIIGYDCINQPNPYVEYILQVSNFYTDSDNPSATTPTNRSLIVSWYVRRRYREFRELHDRLKDYYQANLPTFPPKRFFDNLSPTFLFQRRQELQSYIDTVLAVDSGVFASPLRSFLTVGQSFIPSHSSSSPSVFGHHSLPTSSSCRSHPVTAASSIDAGASCNSTTSVEDISTIVTGSSASPADSGALSPAPVPPAPPSSPNLPPPPNPLPNRFDAQRFPQSSSASNLRTNEDSFLQKTKNQLLDLSDLDERWPDAMDLESRTILYRAVLTIPLPRHLRLTDDDQDQSGAAGGAAGGAGGAGGAAGEDKALTLRPIPQRLWDRLQEIQRNSFESKILGELKTENHLELPI